MLSKSEFQKAIRQHRICPMLTYVAHTLQYHTLYNVPETIKKFFSTYLCDIDKNLYWITDSHLFPQVEPSINPKIVYHQEAEVQLLFKPSYVRIVVNRICRPVQIIHERRGGFRQEQIVSYLKNATDWSAIQKNRRFRLTYLLIKDMLRRHPPAFTNVDWFDIRANDEALARKPSEITTVMLTLYGTSQKAEIYRNDVPIEKILAGLL